MTNITEGLGSSSSSLTIDDDNWCGKVVGRYRLIEPVGAGAQGSVYRGVHVDTEEPCAVKLLHMEEQTNPILIERFRREAKITAKLRHPHIVQIYDFGQLHDGGFYMVMELLEGTSLQRRIDDGEPFSLPVLATLFEQIFGALQFTHEQEVLHRDLKPDNIFLVQQQGRHFVKLIDFGIAAVKETNVKLTRTNAFIGTPTYMSPEQAQGKNKEYDARSELYSVGVILYVLLTGRLPFIGQTFLDLAYQHACATSPTLAEAAPARQWAPALEAFVVQVLAKDREQRPADAAACWALCQEALAAQAQLEQADATIASTPAVSWDQAEQAADVVMAAQEAALFDSAETVGMEAPDFSGMMPDTRAPSPARDEAATEVMVAQAAPAPSSGSKTPWLVALVVALAVAAGAGWWFFF